MYTMEYATFRYDTIEAVENWLKGGAHQKIQHEVYTDFQISSL